MSTRKEKPAGSWGDPSGPAASDIRRIVAELKEPPGGGALVGNIHSPAFTVENPGKFCLWIVSAPPINYKFRATGWGITRDLWDKVGKGSV